MEPSVGMFTGAYRFFTSFWEFNKKRPNIRISIDFDSNESAEGNSLYKYVLEYSGPK